MTTDQLKEIAIKKALQSKCRYKVSAIALNKNGDIVGKSINKHRFEFHRGATHAEMQLMVNPDVKYIYICRVNKSGHQLPIKACDMCEKKSKALNIKIIPL